MIKVQINNEILRLIIEIENKKSSFSQIHLPVSVKNKLRKNSRKKSTYASNHIEGNPLTEKQVYDAIDDPHRHHLKPEQEVLNYYHAINYLDKMLEKKEKLSKELILHVQALVEKGAGREKTGLRGPMPPGVLFAVYDAETGNADYIPPEYSDIPDLLDELVNYADTTDDHPLIIAAVVHYQLVTIHPFEDGNGRTARLISGYILSLYGYDFGGIGSLEEYFAYNPGEYYNSLQMNLPALYYSGRDNPPHPEIWVTYYLRMVNLYADRVNQISQDSREEVLSAGVSYLSAKEKQFLKFLLEKKLLEFTPIEISRMMNVTNHTAANWSAALASNGFLMPTIPGKRIRSYKLTDLTVKNRKEILALLG